MKTLFLAALLLLPLISSAQEHDTIRVCTYSVLNFEPSENAVNRINAFRSVLNEIQPDVILIQGLASDDGRRMFEYSVLGHILTPLVGEPGNLKDQDSYVWVYYNTALFEGIEQFQLIGVDSLRDQIGIALKHKLSSDSLVFFTMHWKAGMTLTDENKRLLSSNDLASSFRRERFEDGIFGGNMNVYTDSEPAYAGLLNIAVDPINRPGNWHNNPDFADIHTQATRGQMFGGGAGGGINERFDQILLSPSLMDNYVPGSYTTFGNDGNHFNDSINAIPNTAVSLEIAQALHDASDHLPVYLDLVFERKTVSVEDEKEWVEGLLDLW